MLVRGCGNAFLLSMAPYMRRIHPNRVNAKRFLSFLFLLLNYRSLKWKKVSTRVIYIRIKLSNIQEQTKVRLTPKVMHIIKPPDLREKSSESLLVILSVIYGSGPIVSPFNHCSWF